MIIELEREISLFRLQTLKAVHSVKPKTFHDRSCDQEILLQAPLCMPRELGLKMKLWVSRALSQPGCIHFPLHIFEPFFNFSVQSFFPCSILKPSSQQLSEAGVRVRVRH